MKILINVILVIILTVVWGIFYKKNINAKKMSLVNKLIIILLIISFNIGSLYIFNISNKKSYFAEFNGIEISLQLSHLKEFLSDQDQDYKIKMKKETVNISSKLLLSHKFNYNRKSKHGIKIVFSDSMSYEKKEKVYLIKLLITYSINDEEKELETYQVLKDMKKINYKKIVSTYENILNEVLGSILFEEKIKSKKSDELISILSHKHNLPDVYYVHIFNKLLKQEKQVVLPDKVLLRFLDKPSTFSEATGYAILTNHCSVINKIIDKSIYFNSSSLETLLSIITQSECKVVKGYLNVLASSSRTDISSLANKYLDEYKKSHQKEIIYKNGKRVSP